MRNIRVGNVTRLEQISSVAWQHISLWPKVPLHGYAYLLRRHVYKEIRPAIQPFKWPPSWV